MTNIIDSHTHIFPEDLAKKAVNSICDFYGFPRKFGQKGTITNLKEKSSEAGVKYLIINSTATTPAQVETINNWIASNISNTVFGLGTIHPDYPDIEKEIERIRTLGLKGIKLHPDFQQFYADDRKLDRIYACAQGVLPILIHSGDKRYDFSAPKRIANILYRFPKLDIVAAHLGGYSRWDEVKKYLLGRRLWFDTSSSLWYMENEEAIEIIRKHGTDKILFGTDYPLADYKKELIKFYELGLSKKEQEDIFFNNTNELYKLNITGDVK